MYSIIKCTPVVFKARPRLGSYGFDANKLNNGLLLQNYKIPDIRRRVFFDEQIKNSISLRTLIVIQHEELFGFKFFFNDNEIQDDINNVVISVSLDNHLYYGLYAKQNQMLTPIQAVDDVLGIHIDLIYLK